MTVHPCGDLVFTNIGRFIANDLVRVDRANLSQGGILQTYLTSTPKWMISQLPNGGDFILVAMSGSDRKLYRLPVAGGSRTVYLDHGISVNAARVDTEGRPVLLWEDTGHTLRVRRYAADLSTYEDWTIPQRTVDLQPITEKAISPDGTKVAAIWVNITGHPNEVRFTEYTLGAAGSTTATDQLTGGDSIILANGGGTLNLAVGYHQDGGVLYAYNSESVVGPDGLGHYTHPVQTIVVKFGGTGGDLSSVVYEHDALPGDTGNEYDQSRAGINGWLYGDGSGGNSRIWGWAWFNRDLSGTGSQAIKLMESATFHLWADDSNPEWTPLWTVDCGSPGLARYPGAGLAATWGPALA